MIMALTWGFPVQLGSLRLLRSVITQR